MKPESTRASKSELKVWEASHFGSSVRMEADDCISGVLHIFDGKQTIQVRLNGTTLTCLAHVLGQWSADVDSK